MCKQNWNNSNLGFANVTTTVNEMENSNVFKEITWSVFFHYIGCFSVLTALVDNE